MIEELKRQANLNTILCKYTEDQINQLYARLFGTDDCQLVLRDMANRCYVDVPTVGERSEGMREVYIHIISCMRNTIRQEEQNES